MVRPPPWKQLVSSTDLLDSPNLQHILHRYRNEFICLLTREIENSRKKEHDGFAQTTYRLRTRTHRKPENLHMSSILQNKQTENERSRAKSISYRRFNRQTFVILPCARPTRKPAKLPN